MKRFLITFILVLAGGTAISAQNAEPYESCKPYTRWWWFKDQIQKKDIRDQLIWAKEAGLGGVEIAWMNARGKEKPKKWQKWLSPEWTEVVVYAKQCADSLGLGCDYTYGTAWPFKSPDLPVKYAHRAFGKEPTLKSGGWAAPRKAQLLDHLSKEAFNCYADIMDKGLKPAYKGSTSAIFVDSWEVNSRAIWTDGLGEKFYRKFGYRIEPMMKYLYDEGYEDYYYDYMEVVGEMVINNFYKEFTKRAHKNGAITRAQCNGSPTDLLSAYMVVDVPETEALLYEPNFSKIAASAATLTSKPVVSSETFTCLYGFGKRPLKNGRGPELGHEQVADMKLVADALFANGTNQIIWHGMPYNEVGSKKKHFYAAVHLGPTAYFAGQIKDFNDYMTRVTKYMRKGSNLCSIAVYLPVEDGHRVLRYPKKLRYPGIGNQFQLSYVRMPEYIDGYQGIWVNREVLVKGMVKKGKLVFGDCSFPAFAADVKYMNIASLKALVKHAKRGLPVLLAQTPLQPGVKKSKKYDKMLQVLKSLPNVSTDPQEFMKKVVPVMEGDNLPEFWCRQDGNDRYIFIANPAACDMHYHLRYCQAFEDNGSVRDVTIHTSAGKKPYRLDFKPNQSILLHLTADGEIKEIDLGFTAKRIEGPGLWE